MSKWVAVSERLPEAMLGEEHGEPIVSDDVLVYFFDAGENTHEIANYDHSTKRWALITHGFTEPDCDPTHWMPLPDSPSLCGGFHGEDA